MSLIKKKTTKTYYKKVLNKYLRKIERNNYLDRDDIEKIFVEIMHINETENRYHGVSRTFHRFVEQAVHPEKNLWKFAQFCLKNQKKSYSKDLQDLWVMSKYPPDYRGIYIEIGAADGIFKSNCYALENKGWIGLCVEPNPELFLKLRSNRKAFCENSAVINEGGSIANKENYVNMYVPKDRPTLGSLNFNAVTNSDFNEIRVNSNTIRELKSKYQLANKIDYVSIDTEGNEIDILKDLLVNFEVSNFSIEYNFDSEKKKLINQIASEYSYVEEFPGIARNDLLFSKINI